MTVHERVAYRLVAMLQPMPKASYNGSLKALVALHKVVGSLEEYNRTMSRANIGTIHEDLINITFGGYTNHFIEVFTKICHILRVRLYCKKILSPGFSEPEDFLILHGPKTSVMLAKRIGIWMNEVEMGSSANIIKSKTGPTTHEDRWTLKTNFYKGILDRVIHPSIHYQTPDRNYDRALTYNYGISMANYLREKYPNNPGGKGRLYTQWTFKDGYFLMVSRKSKYTKHELEQD